MESKCWHINVGCLKVRCEQVCRLSLLFRQWRERMLGNKRNFWLWIKSLLINKKNMNNEFILVLQLFKL